MPARQDVVTELATGYKWSRMLLFCYDVINMCRQCYEIPGRIESTELTKSSFPFSPKEPDTLRLTTSR